MSFLPWRNRTSWCWPACLAVALLAGAGASTGCAKKVVAAPAPPPPLEMPVVPPRLVGPVVVEDEVPAPVAEAPEPAPVRPTARPPRPGARGNGEAVRQDPAPAESSGASRPEQGEASAPAPPSEPLLRTPDTANDTEASRRVRDTLGRAQKNLERVDYRTLSVNARAQADTARRFITQADAALKNRQITFARYLADKAETLSTSLLNR